MNIVGPGDTHIKLEPEHPHPGGTDNGRYLSSTREHTFTNLMIKRPNQEPAEVTFRGQTVDTDRHVWQYQFETDMDGLYEIRFVGDAGARLLALRLLRVAREVQLVPSSSARMDYTRVYVLLPPTADESWLLAAARGGYNRAVSPSASLQTTQGLVTLAHATYWPSIPTTGPMYSPHPGSNNITPASSSPPSSPTPPKI